MQHLILTCNAAQNDRSNVVSVLVICSQQHCCLVSICCYKAVIMFVVIECVCYCVVSQVDCDEYSEMHLLPEPLFTLPTDNVHMLNISSTDSGRIFLAGKDGCLYEVAYQVVLSSLVVQTYVLMCCGYISWITNAFVWLQLKKKLYNISCFIL